ncbi:putative protein phosphatase 2C 52 [Acorus gramineus]|uniref:protein-serine/threonine phosphatase n=1 Tax=Acorus gramineus TaxID=55184 RepID=A0AAV9B037_ACOGR|nr:putative protein phosphatase 2C 52 [Acorus gramineus]
MLCSASLRSAVVRAVGLPRLLLRRRELDPNPRSLFSPKRGFRAFVSTMMVDVGGMTANAADSGAVVDVLPRKERNHNDGDGRLSCGFSSFRGKRVTMEDFFDVKLSKVDGQTVCMFGIFDGHGGSRAAEYLKEHLFENLMKHPLFMTDTKRAISDTYQKTDSEFLDSESHSSRDDGSTASTDVLVGRHLYVANVGDSRAVISKAGKGTSSWIYRESVLENELYPSDITA